VQRAWMANLAVPSRDVLTGFPAVSVDHMFYWAPYV